MTQGDHFNGTETNAELTVRGLSLVTQLLSSFKLP